MIDVSKLSQYSYLNACLAKGEGQAVILACEQVHEQKMNAVYREIVESGKKVVLITGPSSSGKTTFANRLAAKFDVPPLVLSVDDFFYGNDEVEKDDSIPDFFETILAVNVELLNQTVYALLDGLNTPIPAFDFVKGRCIRDARYAQLQSGQIIMVEGIHAFHHALMPAIGEEKKYGLFVYPSADAITKEEVVTSRQLRLVRRCIRDRLFRGCPIERTLVLWKGVVDFEKANIMLFRKEADYVFDSFLPYEPAITAPLLHGFLKECEKNESVEKLQEIVNRLNQYPKLPAKWVPANSILKEFIGDYDDGL